MLKEFTSYGLSDNFQSTSGLFKTSSTTVELSPPLYAVSFKIVKLFIYLFVLFYFLFFLGNIWGIIMIKMWFGVLTLLCLILKKIEE